METLRTFVAIDVKVEQMLKRKWQELKTLLKNDSIKWVDEHSLHLTLFFLSNTPIDTIDEIAQKLDQELQKTSSLKIKLQGVGTFGNPNLPRVIWVGISKSEQLLVLMKAVRAAISSFGFDEPDGDFSPHFTLGRVKQLKSTIELINYINSNKSEILQEAEIDKVIFYQSILTPKGPEYKTLKEIKLLSP